MFCETLELIILIFLLFHIQVTDGYEKRVREHHGHVNFETFAELG